MGTNRELTIFNRGRYRLDVCGFLHLSKTKHDHNVFIFFFFFFFSLLTVLVFMESTFLLFGITAIQSVCVCVRVRVCVCVCVVCVCVVCVCVCVLRASKFKSEILQFMNYWLFFSRHSKVKITGIYQINKIALKLIFFNVVLYFKGLIKKVGIQPWWQSG